MGYTSYSTDSRSARAVTKGYATKSANDIFEQNKERKIHESMDPKKAKLRESMDSEIHPLSVPIILALDVTGSMLDVPVHLIREDLPKMMSNIIEHGIKDPQVLFLAIGDAETDYFPLQVGQFESGDEELDLWLTRTYLEGHGGGNGGESYSLAWYFAAFHTVTDAWNKRKQKGFLFTVGDEPCLRNLSVCQIKEVLEETPETSFSEKELLKRAQERYNVYHLHVLEGVQGHNSLNYWKELLGDHCIAVADHREVGNVIAKIVTTNVHESVITTKKEEKIPEATKEEEIIL